MDDIIPPIQLKLMSSPLVSWVNLFRSTEDGDQSVLLYRDLYQGAFLRDIMQQISGRHIEDNFITQGAKLDESMERLLNWNVLLKAIKTFYRDELGQIIVMKLPDIIRLAREPEDESSYDEIKLTLLLLLGCAVQCDRKEFYVSQITQELPVESQIGIMERIQQITDNTDNFVPIDPLESGDATSKAMHYHLSNLLEERDIYIEEAAKATVESDIYLTELDELRAQQLQSANSPEKHHIGVELAEYKAKVRRLRQELEKEREEKAEQVQEYQDELTQQKDSLAKLRTENLSLTQDARSTRAYRDELDIVKEKARKVDKLERQLQSYKDKITELDFYKARVDELREDNKILIETKVMLDDQLATSQKRVETIIDLENELIDLRKEREEFNSKRDEDRRVIAELTECITRLECDKNNTLNESANLEEELAHVRGLASSDLSQSLRDQMSETSSTEVLRLQLENQRLQRLMVEQKETVLVENSSHLLELEKENQRLAMKVEKLQDTSTKSGQEYLQLEQENQNYQRQVNEIKNTIETVKESADRQVKELERDNEQLSATIESLRQRNEQSIDLRVKDVERENKNLTETVQEVSQQLSKLDYDYRTLQKNHTVLQGQVDKVERAEEQNEKLEKENTELSKTVATLKLTVDKYEEIEQELSDREVENKKLLRQVENLKSKADQVEKLSDDNVKLTVENQQLAKTLAAAKNSSATILELEHEKEDKEKEITVLQKTVQQLQSHNAKASDLEVKLLSQEGEFKKVQRNLELHQKKLDNKAQEYEELREENKKLEGSNETLRLSMRKLEEVEKDNRALEESNTSLIHEKDAKEKELRKLKQTLEVKESAIDEYTAKVNLLEREQKSLKRSGDKWRNASVRFKEQDSETRELMQRSKIDRKTIAALREELVQEKINSQQLLNELEKLKTELANIGFNKDKHEADELAQEEDRLKVLQTMMKEAHEQTSEVKDEKIRTLELHLEESKNLNATLTRQLDTMQKEYEAFMQRRKEGPAPVTTTINVTSPGKQSSSISQLVIKKPQQTSQLQTHEVVIRQNEIIALQKKNATLLSENAGLKSKAMYAEERMKKLESTDTTHKSQLTAVRGEKNSLQAQYAQLQVENTTLQSQSNSLLKQNTSLKQQLAKLQSDFEETAISHQELNETYESLVADHEQLQQLNDQLSSEYEALISEHAMLKSQHKQLKADSAVVRRDRQELSKEKAAVEELRQSIYKERVSMVVDDTATEQLEKAQEDKHYMQQQTDKIRGEYRDLLSEYKNVKTEYNQLKLKHTELNGEFAECRDQNNKMDIQLAKLSNRIDAVEQMNGRLEEENRQLVHQLQALLQQNQDLLSSTLESSEHFHEEELQYREQLSNLKRAKEKLEEKIMDQYKNYDRTHKKKGFGAAIVRKAKGFIAKRNRDPTRRQTISGIPYGSTEDSNPQLQSPDLTAASPSLRLKRQQQDRLGAKGIKDLTKSQLDLHLGLANLDTGDTQSLGGVSIGSRGSTQGSENGNGPDNLTLTKNNKVKIRRSRVKAQSIENLFESPSSAPSSDPRDSGLNHRFSTTLNLRAQHKKMASSTTALNMPMSGGRLRAARSTEDLLGGHEDSPYRGQGSTLPGGGPNHHKLVRVSGRRRQRRTSTDSTESDFAVSHRGASSQGSDENRDSDEIPTKDVGLKLDVPTSARSAGSGSSMFYTPPTTNRSGHTSSGSSRDEDVDVDPTEEEKGSRSRLQKRATLADIHEYRQLEYKERLIRAESLTSPKPDVVMGTESSPRALLYYDNTPQHSQHRQDSSKSQKTSTPKSAMTSSRSHPTNMYASLDSRIDSTGRIDSPGRRPDLYASQPGLHGSRGSQHIPTQSVRPISKSSSSNGSFEGRGRDGLMNGQSRGSEIRNGPSSQANKKDPEADPMWYEYGCV